MGPAPVPTSSVFASPRGQCSSNRTQVGGGRPPTGPSLSQQGGSSTCRDNPQESASSSAVPELPPTFSDSFADSIVECRCSESGLVSSFEVHSSVLVVSSPLLCCAITAFKHDPNRILNWDLTLESCRPNSFEKDSTKIGRATDENSCVSDPIGCSESEHKISVCVRFVDDQFVFTVDGLNTDVVTALFNVFYFEDWQLYSNNLPLFTALLKTLKCDDLVDIENLVYSTFEEDSQIGTLMFVDCEDVSLLNGKNRGLKLLASFFMLSKSENEVRRTLNDYQFTVFATYLVPRPSIRHFDLGALTLQSVLAVVGLFPQQYPVASFTVDCSKPNGNFGRLDDYYTESNYRINIVTKKLCIEYTCVRKPIKISFSVDITNSMLNVIKTAGGMGLHVAALDQLMGGPIKKAKANLNPVLKALGVTVENALGITYDDRVNNPRSIAKRQSAIIARNLCNNSVVRELKHHDTLQNIHSSNISGEPESSRSVKRRCTSEVGSTISSVSNTKTSIGLAEEGKSSRRRWKWTVDAQAAKRIAVDYSGSSALTNGNLVKKCSRAKSASISIGCVEGKKATLSKKSLNRNVFVCEAIKNRSVNKQSAPPLSLAGCTYESSVAGIADDKVCHDIRQIIESVILKSCSQDLNKQNLLAHSRKENCYASNMPRKGKLVLIDNLVNCKDEAGELCETLNGCVGMKQDRENSAVIKALREPINDVSCTTEYSLKRPAALAGAERPLRRCPACRLRFVSPKPLLVHMQQQHLQGVNQPRGCPCVDPRCPVSIRVFNEVTHLLKHVVQSRHNCRCCSFSCATKGGLSRHLSLHEPTNANCKPPRKTLGPKKAKTNSLTDRPAFHASTNFSRSSSLSSKPLNAVPDDINNNYVLQSGTFDDLDTSADRNEDFEKLLTFNRIVQQRKSKSQRPRPKGEPPRHLGIRLPKYVPVDTKENTDQEMSEYKPPPNCFVCNLDFGSSCTPVGMALHYYDQHRKKAPRPCPFPECPLILRQAPLMLEHVRHHLWLRRFSCLWCSYSANNAKTIKLHARAHAHVQALGASSSSQTFGQVAMRAAPSYKTRRDLHPGPSCTNGKTHRSAAGVALAAAVPVKPSPRQKAGRGVCVDAGPSSMFNTAPESRPAPALAARKFLRRPPPRVFADTPDQSLPPTSNVYKSPSGTHPFHRVPDQPLLKTNRTLQTAVESSSETKVLPMAAAPSNEMVFSTTAEEMHGKRRSSCVKNAVDDLPDLCCGFRTPPSLTITRKNVSNAARDLTQLNTRTSEPNGIGMTASLTGSDRSETLRQIISRVPSSVTVLPASVDSAYKRKSYDLNNVENGLEKGKQCTWSGSKKKKNSPLPNWSSVTISGVDHSRSFKAATNESTDYCTNQRERDDSLAPVGELPESNSKEVLSNDSSEERWTDSDVEMTRSVQLSQTCPHCPETSKCGEDICKHFMDVHVSKSEFFCPFCIYNSVPKNITRLGRNNFREECLQHLLTHYQTPTSRSSSNDVAAGRDSIYKAAESENRDIIPMECLLREIALQKQLQLKKSSSIVNKPSRFESICVKRFPDSVQCVKSAVQPAKSCLIGAKESALETVESGSEPMEIQIPFSRESNGNSFSRQTLESGDSQKLGVCEKPSQDDLDERGEGFISSDEDFDDVDLDENYSPFKSRKPKLKRYRKASRRGRGGFLKKRGSCFNSSSAKEMFVSSQSVGNNKAIESSSSGIRRSFSVDHIIKTLPETFANQSKSKIIISGSNCNLSKEDLKPPVSLVTTGAVFDTSVPKDVIFPVPKSLHCISSVSSAFKGLAEDAKVKRLTNKVNEVPGLDSEALLSSLYRYSSRARVTNTASLSSNISPIPAVPSLESLTTPSSQSVPSLWLSGPPNIDHASASNFSSPNRCLLERKEPRDSMRNVSLQTGYHPFAFPNVFPSFPSSSSAGAHNQLYSLQSETTQNSNPSVGKLTYDVFKGALHRVTSNGAASCAETSADHANDASQMDGIQPLFLGKSGAADSVNSEKESDDQKITTGQSEKASNAETTPNPSCRGATKDSAPIRSGSCFPKFEFPAQDMAGMSCFDLPSQFFSSPPSPANAFAAPYFPFSPFASPAMFPYCPGNSQSTGAQLSFPGHKELSRKPIYPMSAPQTLTDGQQPHRLPNSDNCPKQTFPFQGPPSLSDNRSSPFANISNVEEAARRMPSFGHFQPRFGAGGEVGTQDQFMNQQHQQMFSYLLSYYLTNTTSRINGDERTQERP